MEVVTRWARAAAAARSWHEAYDWQPADYRLADGRDPHEVARRLDALGESPHPDDVDRVVGNPSWTEVLKCDECGRENLPAVVRVGEEPAYDASYCYLCGMCLIHALNLLETT